MKKATISLHTLPLGKKHLDIFFQADTVLKTYESEFLNPDPVNQEFFCIQKADHRVEYLDYEGIISGNRGSVKILWKGVYNDKLFTFYPELKISVSETEIHTILSPG